MHCPLNQVPAPFMWHPFFKIPGHRTCWWTADPRSEVDLLMEVTTCPCHSTLVRTLALPRSSDRIPCVLWILNAASADPEAA